MGTENESGRPGADAEPEEREDDERDRGQRRSPTGEYGTVDETWLSGGDDDEPLREEAAERARRAVEPGRPRE